MTQILHERSNGDDLAQFDYTHDAAGNRTSSTEQFDTDNNGTLDHSQTFTYDYDALNRLRTETFDAPGTTDDYVHHYAFDANTNRKSWSKDNGSTNPFTTTYDEEVTYTHDANDRLLTEASTTNGNTTYEFGPNADHPNDYAGDHTNQTKKTTINGGTTETHTYTYNEMGRLSGVTITKTGQPTTSETYTYNADGLRVTTTANGTTKTYLFDTTNPTGYAQVLEEKVNGSVTETYTLGLDVLNHKTTTGQLLTLLYDAHGSTRMLLNDAASVLINNVLQLFSYDAYGNSLGFDPSASLTTLLYSGEWTRPDGTQWLRGRDIYNPQLARFSSLDPYSGKMDTPHTLNKYGYGHQDGINAIDPSGHFSISDNLSVSGISNFLIGNVMRTANLAVRKFYQSLWPVFSPQALGIRSLATAQSYATLLGKAMVARTMTTFALNSTLFAWPVLSNIPALVPKLRTLSNELAPINSLASSKISWLANEAQSLVNSVWPQVGRNVAASQVSSSIGLYGLFHAGRKGINIWGMASAIPETIAFNHGGLSASGSGGVNYAKLFYLAMSGQLNGEVYLQSAIDLVRAGKSKDQALASQAVADANKWLGRFSGAQITGSIDFDRWNDEASKVVW